MYKLVGYQISKGVMKTDNGNEIEYDNRNLKCLTDYVAEDVVGQDLIEQKMKTASLASHFGCVPSEVNSYLDSILGEEIEFTFVPVKGKLQVNGFKVVEPVENPVKSMKEVVDEKRENAKKG